MWQGILKNFGFFGGSKQGLNQLVLQGVVACDSLHCGMAGLAANLPDSLPHIQTLFTSKRILIQFVLTTK